MSDWLNQFTSSYASSIAYGISALILSIVLKPVFLFFSERIKSFLEVQRSKKQNKIALPAKEHINRFSSKQKITESEWNDAIEYLKNDIPALTNNLRQSRKQSLGLMDKAIRIFQIVSGLLALIYLTAIIFRAPSWKVGGQIILIISSCFVAVIAGWIFIYEIQETARIKKIKIQARPAMETLFPKNTVLTNVQLGEFLIGAKEKDLPRLQSELSDIGLPFALDDIKFAHFLATAPPEKLLPIGEGMASRLASTEQFSKLSPDEKKEFAEICIEALRRWPVSLEITQKTRNKNAG